MKKVTINERPVSGGRLTVTSTPNSLSRLTSERGQTTIFFIAAFWTLFLFLAFVVNAGQVINRRVTLQMIADSGAWTGAAKQAQVLNSLSQMNDLERNFVFLPSQILTVDFTVTIEPLGGIAYTLWTVGNNIYKIAFRLRNQLGNFEAASAAAAVTKSNASELFQGESLSFPEPAAYTVAELIKVKKVSKNAGSNTQYVAIYWIGENTYTVDLSEVWNIADDNHKIVNFLWWVHAPPTGGHVLPSVFTIPEMTAAALAKPTNGSLDPENGGSAHDDGYKARMIPLTYLKKSSYSGYLATVLGMGQMGADAGKLMGGIYLPISTAEMARILH